MKIFFIYSISILLLNLLIISCEGEGGDSEANEFGDSNFNHSEKNNSANLFTNEHITEIIIDATYVHGVHTFYAKSITEEKIIFQIPSELGEILSINFKKIATTEKVLSHFPEVKQTISFKDNGLNLLKLKLKDESDYTLNIEINKVSIDNNNLFIKELKLLLSLGNTSQIYEGVIDEKHKTIIFYLNYKFIFTDLSNLKGVISDFSFSENAQTNIKVGHYLNFKNNETAIILQNKDNLQGYKSYKIKIDFLPANNLSELFSLQSQVQYNGNKYNINAVIKDKDVFFTMNTYDFDTSLFNELDIIGFDISNYATLSATRIALTDVNTYQKKGIIKVISESGKENEFNLIFQRLANYQTEIADLDLELTAKGTVITFNNVKVLNNKIAIIVNEGFIDFNSVKSLKLNKITLTNFATIDINTIDLFNNSLTKAYGRFSVLLENQEYKKYDLVIGRNLNDENELIKSKLQIKYKGETLIFPLKKENNTFSFLTQSATYNWNLVKSFALVDYQLSNFADIENATPDFKLLNEQRTIKATVAVIAENLQSQEYEILLQRPISSYNTITRIKIKTDDYSNLEGLIDQENETITFEIPAPTRNILDFTQIEITDIDLIKNFTFIDSTIIVLDNINQVTNVGTLNVKAEDDSIKSYQLIVNRKLNNQNKVQRLIFKLYYAGKENELIAEYNEYSKNLNVELPQSLKILLHYTGEMTITDIISSMYSKRSNYSYSIRSKSPMVVNEKINFVTGASSITIVAENGEAENYKLFLRLFADKKESQIMYERFMPLTPLSLDLNKNIIAPVIKNSNINMHNDKMYVVKKKIKQLSDFTVSDRINNNNIQNKNFKIQATTAESVISINLYKLFDRDFSTDFAFFPQTTYCKYWDQYAFNHLLFMSQSCYPDSKKGLFNINIQNINNNINIRKLQYYISPTAPIQAIVYATMQYNTHYSGTLDDYNSFLFKFTHRDLEYPATFADFVNTDGLEDELNDKLNNTYIIPSTKKHYYYPSSDNYFNHINKVSFHLKLDVWYDKRYDMTYSTCMNAPSKYRNGNYIFDYSTFRLKRAEYAKALSCTTKQPNFAIGSNIDMQYVDSSEEHSYLPLEYLPTNFTSNNQNGYIISSNNIYLNYEPWKAVNLSVYKENETPLQWLAVSNNNQNPYWQIELPKPKVLKYLLLAGPDYDTVLPDGRLLKDHLNPQSFHINDYAILGSKDGSLWDDLTGRIQTPIEFLSFSEIFLKNQTAYKFYRIQAYNLQHYGGISQLKMAFESEVILHNINLYNKKLLAKHAASYNLASIKKELSISSSANENKNDLPFYDNNYNQQKELYWFDSSSSSNPYWQISLSSTQKTLVAFSFFTPNKNDANTEYRILGSNSNFFNDVLTKTPQNSSGWISDSNMIDTESFHYFNNAPKYQNYRIEWKAANQKIAYLKRVKLYFKENVYNNKFRNSNDLSSYSVINHLPVYDIRDNKDVLNYKVSTSSTTNTDIAYQLLLADIIPWGIDKSKKQDWWQIELPEEKTLLGYSFRGEKSTPLNTSSVNISVTLQGAKGIMWENIHTASGINLDIKNIQVFKIENPIKFDKYRLYINKTNDAQSISISDIRFTFLEDLDDKSIHIAPLSDQTQNLIEVHDYFHYSNLMRYKSDFHFNLLMNTLEEGLEVWKNSEDSYKNLKIYNIRNISDLPVFTQDSEQGYSILSNSVLSNNHPYHAVSDNVDFDKKSWRALNNVDVYWSITLPVPKTLKWLYLQGVLDPVNITNFKVQGSNDTVNWKDITANLKVGISYHQPKTFYLLNEEKFKNYRIYIIESKGDNPGFSKINMLFKEDNNEVIIPGLLYSFYNMLANIYQKLDLLDDFDTHLPSFNDGEFSKDGFILSSSNDKQPSLVSNFDDAVENKKYWLDDKEDASSWFKIKMPDIRQRVLRAISFVGSEASNNTTYFTQFQIQGSDDTNIWEAVTDIISKKLDNSKVHKLIIPNRRYYRYYRILFINKANSSKSAGFTNFKAQFLKDSF